MMETPEDNKIEKPGGRIAILGRWKAAYPDREEDPTDDEMWEYAHQGYNERDEYHNSLQSVNEANQKLFDAISEDPRFADLMAMIGNGVKPLVALGRVFGTLIDNLDESAIAELEAGQAEYASNHKKLRENYQKYLQTLDTYMSENGYDQAFKEKIKDIIYEMSEMIINWDIDADMIDTITKGVLSDEENNARIAAERLDAKNEAIDELKQTTAGGGSGMPDVGGMKKNAGAKKIKTLTPVNQNMADAFVEKE